MDIAVKTDLLKKVVSSAARASSSKAIQPILNNILLACVDGSLVVSATDLDLAIECKLPADIAKPGRVTLPAKKLDEIVNRAAGEDVSISIEKNNLARILSNRSKFQINGSSSEEFPEVIKKNSIEKLYTVDQNTFLQAISLTSFAASRFETTSILSGVNFLVEGDKFEIAATDGSRLAKYTAHLKESPKGSKTKVQAVIPVRALVELERLISTFKEGNDTVSFGILDGQVIVQNNDFTLSTRLINGNFPEYDNLIPKSQPNKLTFMRSTMLSSIERVAILANERTSIIKLSFKKGTNTVNLSANSPDYGNAQDEIDAEYNGDDLDVAFNYRYLAEALRNLDTDEIVLELDTSLSPILLKTGEKKEYSYTYLVMPVQLR